MLLLKELQFSIGGYSSNNYKLSLVGSRLMYNKSSYSYLDEVKETTLEISKQQLEHLVSNLNILKVEDWKKEYVDETMMDGVQWELELEYDNESKKTFGSNSYPNYNSETDSSTDFERFLLLLRELTGDEKFFLDD